jgi:hypothetical protein
MKKPLNAKVDNWPGLPEDAKNAFFYYFFFFFFFFYYTISRYPIFRLYFKYVYKLYCLSFRIN